MSSYSPEQDDLLKRLRRIEGQVAGISRMVADDRYCIDVLTQVSAATSALQSVSLKLLDAHLAGCVVEAAKQVVGSGRQDQGSSGGHRSSRSFVRCRSVTA
ncbi:hypothetical protein GCM10020255_061900 [Rhodococcus baikonurensis]